MLPKPRSGEDVHTLSIALNHAEERAGAAAGATRIIAIATEMPISLLSMPTYIASSSRLAGLTWGAGGPVGRARLVAPTREADGRWTSPYRLARDLCALHGGGRQRAADRHGVRRFQRRGGPARRKRALAARDGFTGKMAIHPDQVAVINEMFTPSARGDRPREAIVRLFADNPDAGALVPRRRRWSTART